MSILTQKNQNTVLAYIINNHNTIRNTHEEEVYDVEPPMK